MTEAMKDQLKIGTLGALVQTVVAIVGAVLGSYIFLDTRFGDAIKANDTRITAIEHTRFTPENALKVWEAIARLQEKAAMPSDPPQWLVDRLDRIEAKVDAVID